MEGERRAVRRKTAGDGDADAACRSRDEGDAALLAAERIDDDWRRLRGGCGRRRLRFWSRGRFRFRRRSLLAGDVVFDVFAVDHVPFAERRNIRQFNTLLTREDFRGGSRAEGGLLLRGGGLRRKIADIYAAGRRLQMGGDFGFVGGGDVRSGFAFGADGAQRVAVGNRAFLLRINCQNCPVFRSFQL